MCAENMSVDVGLISECTCISKEIVRMGKRLFTSQIRFGREMFGHNILFDCSSGPNYLQNGGQLLTSNVSQSRL